MDPVRCKRWRWVHQLTLRGLLVAGVILAPPLARWSLALSNPSSSADPSTADLSTTLRVERLFRLSHVGILNFPAYTGSGNPSLSDDVCVWTNHASGTYRVTANGSGESSAFVLTRTGPGPSGTVPFGVTWATPSTTVSLTASTASANLTGANTTSTSCGGSPTSATFTVTINRSNLLSQPTGSYSGTLSFVISAPTN